MTDRDPAFLWETEALRSATHRVVEQEVDRVDPPTDNGRWVTLRQASRATGIPVETLRKWARRSTIPSYLSPTSHGSSIRMVELDGIEQRASELGRAIPDPTEEPTQPVSDPPRQVDTAAPPGTMIVPIDAWNKMLNQLGNLHEAGQQLASARERAAKAETEAKFLRERLAELRGAETVAPIAEPRHEKPEPPAETPQSSEKVWQFLVRRMRDRTRG